MQSREMNKVTFNPANHEYLLDGVKIPSVTQILSNLKISDYSGINADTLARAGVRGTFVHEIIQYYEMGILDVNSIDENLQGYFDAYLKYKKDCKIKKSPDFMEKLVYHPTLKYAGTLDQYFINDKWINDIKTGEEQYYNGLQLSAYWFAMFNDISIKPNKLTCLYLKGNGNYKLVKYNYEPFIWMNCVTLEKWINKNK